MGNVLDQLSNKEAEQTVLGIFLTDNSYLKETSLTADNFHFKNHRKLFKAMQAISEKGNPVDIVSIAEKLGNDITEVGGIGYLSDLQGSIATTVNFKYYESLITAHWKKRAAMSLLGAFKEELLNPENENAVSDLISQLSEIEDQKAETEFDIKDLLRKMYDEYCEDKPEINGMETGYPDLDKLTGGLQKQDLVIVAARPSMGKTAFVLNIARQATQKGSVVGMFSLEMSENKIMERVLSALCNIPAIKFRNPKRFFTTKEWQDFNKCIGYISENMNLEIYDKPGVTMPEIYAKSRRLRKKNPDKDIIIMIDYLQLITGSPKHKGNRVQEVSEISRQLKLLARELDVTVIALSQLSRQVEQRQDKRPMMSDLRESGGIEQDADVIGFLYRDDYYNPNSMKPGICEFIISKHRNGPLGTIEFVFAKDYSKFLSSKGGEKHAAV